MSAPWLEASQSTGWPSSPLKHLVRFRGGNTPKDEPEFWGGDVPWVSPKDMRRPLIDDTEDHLTQRALDVIRLVPADAVLIVVRSGVLQHTIPTALTARPVTLNQDMKALICCARVLPRFLKHFIDGWSDALLLAWRKEGATVESIEHQFLANTEVALPPLDEQRAIADFLDQKTAAIDALIAKKERLLALLDEKRQALITQAVTKGLDPSVRMKESGVEWLGPVPAHWQLRRVKHCTDFVTSGSRAWSEFFVDGPGALFLQSGNLDGALGLDLSIRQHVDPPRSAEGERTAVRVGDVLVCITGGLTGNVGYVATELGRAYVNQHLALARPARAVCIGNFLGLVLASTAGREALGAAQYGLKQGLSLDNVRNVWIPCPSVEEQRLIVRAVSMQLERVLELTAKTRLSINLLKEYRQALITAAVTGQLDVRSKQARAMEPAA